MKGWIYVIGSFEHLHFVKVGMSRNRPDSRASELQVGNPFNLQIWGCFPVTRGNIKECEAVCHKAMDEHHHRSEWYKCHPKEALKIVEASVSEYNSLRTAAKKTMAAA